MTRKRLILQQFFIGLAVTAALPGPAIQAARAESLTVYASQGGERADWLTDRARAAGHDITVLSAGGGEIFDRLLAERRNPQADVVLGLVDASMATLKAEGLFQAYEPAWADGLPAAYRDDADRMVYKFWQTPIVLAYNPDAMPAGQAPASWLDLVEPQYAGKYVIGSTAWQTTRAWLTGILVRFADADGNIAAAGWDFMRRLYDNGIVVDSPDAKTAAFVNGEAVIDLNWFGGAVRLGENAGYTPVMVDTEGGTPFIAEGIAIMQGTDRLAQAQAFVDWFGSPAFMAAWATEFGQLPAHPEAIALSPAAVQANATLLTPQAIDWDAVAPLTDGWMQTVELDIR